MNGLALLWVWLLKYSAFLASGVLSVLVAWYIDRFITRRAKLLVYANHPQWVTLPPPQGQPVLPPVETFSLYLFNQGKAVARDVHVGHYWLPAYNVYPDLPRDIIATPGGGTAIHFAVIPPGTLITISYLIFGNFAVDNIVSYISSEEGQAQRIPVILQRVFPTWIIRLGYVLLFLGGWVMMNLSIGLIHYLWVRFYK
jgi:hypothetical protein